MNAMSRWRRAGLVAALALLGCSAVLALARNASAEPIDDPSVPGLARATAGTVATEPGTPGLYLSTPGRYDSSLPVATERATHGPDSDDPSKSWAAWAAAQDVDLPPRVVTREVAPASDGGDDTLSIVLSSTALLVALGGAGYMVIAARRLRRSPQPGG